MTFFIALILTVLTLVFVTYPLLKRRTPSANSVEDEKLQEVYAKRDITYSMIKELEFDFQSGILTEEDYRDLEAKYKGEAVSILKDINNLEKGSDVE
jgi:cytochrome c-type biogenesis protein CcmI